MKCWSDCYKLLPFNEDQSLKGLGIDVPMEENEVEWAAYWDSQFDIDGYLSSRIETEENAVAMSARATAAAAGGSLTRCPNLGTTDFRYPSELISAQRNGSGWLQGIGSHSAAEGVVFGSRAAGSGVQHHCTQ